MFPNEALLWQKKQRNTFKTKLTPLCLCHKQIHSNADAFNQDVTNWNVCACTSFTAMFSNSGYSGSSLSTDGCTFCPAGRYTEGTGKNVYGGIPCTECGAGKYSETEGSIGCEDCEAGKYSDAVGASSLSTCSSCEEGKSSAAGSSICCIANRLHHQQHT